MTSDLGGRVTPQLARPTGFYTTHDVKMGEAVKVGTLAIIEPSSGELVDATPTSVQTLGTPVMVDRGEHPIPEDGETALDNRNGSKDYEQGVKARAEHGAAYLLNVKESIDQTDAGSEVYAIDNDTVSLNDDDVGDGSGNTIPRVGHILRVESAANDTAFVLVDGLS